MAVPTPRDETFDLFVSYAHADDRDGWIAELVKVLKTIQADKDKSQPWRVFFDAHAIRLMDDWEQRIGKGLRSAGVMLALMSPAYFRSEWCRKEWEEFCKEEERRNRPNRIVALYLETDAAYGSPAESDEWRRDLKRRQFLDVRGWRRRRPWGTRWLPRLLGQSARDRAALTQDARISNEIERLVWRVHTRLVELGGAPFPRDIQPPEHFVRRPEEMDRLKAAVLAPDTGTGMPVSVLWGLGGVGKSTLAGALLYEVKDHFPDGILWVTLGQQPEVRGLLRSWIEKLGDNEFQGSEPQAAKHRLLELLQDKKVLLVVDDAWRLEDVEWFRVGGPRCRMLITTRDDLIARKVGARPIELDPMTPGQAVELLRKYLHTRGRDLPPADEALARELAREVGYLPLALELVAAQVADDQSWAALLDALRAEVARLEKLDQVGAEDVESEGERKRLSLTASLNLSVGRLPAERRECFAWMGVLPDDALLTVGLGSVLWSRTEDAAEEMLRYLRSKALLQAGPARQDGSPTYRVHDVLHNHARRLLTAPREPGRAGALAGLGFPLPKAHRELLQRYRRRTQDGLWHTLPPDGYVHDHLAWHLEQADDEDGLHALLREETPEGRNGWFEANERLGQSATFANDVARADRLAEKAFLTGRPGGLGLRCRYALVTASLNSLAGNVSPGLLVALVRQGAWPVTQALAYARRVPALDKRVSAFAAIVSILPEAERGPLLAEALQAARAIGNEWPRSGALAALAPQLAGAVLAEALQAARAIGDRQSRSRALAALAPQLPEAERGPLLAEALQAARAIGNELYRSLALAALAPQLPEAVLAEALQAARAIGNELYRSLALAALAPQLPEAERGPLLAEASQTARAIGNEWSRSEALAALAPQLPEAQRGPLLAEALQAARAVVDKGSPSTLLVALAAQLAELPRANLARLWDETLPVLAARRRNDLLSDLRALTPVLTALAKPNLALEFQEVARAIIDAGRWWP